MTTQHQNQPPPRVDWSTANLSTEQSDDLYRLFDIEQKYRIAAAVGMAFIGYVSNGQPSNKDIEMMELAWDLLIVNDAY